MRRCHTIKTSLPPVLILLGLLVSPTAHALTAGDVNGDDKLDAVDVQLVINSALGLPVPFSTDITYAGGTDAIDVQLAINAALGIVIDMDCLLYTSPSPRDRQKSRMPSSA